LWSGERDYRVGEVRRQQRRALTVQDSEGCAFIRSGWFAESRRLVIRCPRWRAAAVIHSTRAPTTARARCCPPPGRRLSACCR
jgi:hypothetical protein